MTENMIQNLETTLVEDVEVEETAEELSVETVVAELTETVFGADEEITAYKIANVINGAFKVLGVAKMIPTQMMYNYTKNGLIAKGKKGSAKEIRYTKAEVNEFAAKYVNKYAN